MLDIDGVALEMEVDTGAELSTIDWHKLLQCRSLHQIQGESLQQEFLSVFKEELGLLVGMEAEIELKEDAKPKFCKSRPIPFALCEKVEEAIRQQVADGELEPVDQSVWVVPIVVVTKKSGDIHICADFKMTINPQLCIQTFSLPTVDEIFSVLANGESFSKIDLARAYKQMRVAKGSQTYLTINTPLGLYTYLRLPFGIASAPTIWQKAMTTVLQGCKGVVYYLDDILITGNTREEHVENLRNVMARLQTFRLKVNASKCKYFQSELEFLGHVVALTQRLIEEPT